MNNAKNKTGSKGSKVQNPKPKPKNPEGRSSIGSALTRRFRNDAPSVSGSPFSGDGSIVVRHREYIADVLGSVAYAVTSFSVNPGLSTTFPWLSTVAANYESYKFRRLQFLYETSKSTNTSGSLMLSMDYDAADSSPSSKVEQMAMFNAVRSAVWDECVLSGDKKDLQKFGVQRYLRNAALAANLDIKTYDIGNFLVGTIGCADTSTLGELYVEYEVELHTPQLSNQALAATGERITGNTSISKTQIFGTAPTTAGFAYFSASVNTITCLVAGTYMIVASAAGTGTTTISNTVTGTATAAALGSAGVCSNGAATQALFLLLVTASVGQTVIFDLSGGTTVTAFNVRVAEWSSGVATGSGSDHFVMVPC